MESIALYFFTQELRPVFVAHPPLSLQPKRCLKTSHLHVYQPFSALSVMDYLILVGMGPGAPNDGDFSLPVLTVAMQTELVAVQRMAQQNTGTFHKTVQHYSAKLGVTGVPGAEEAVDEAGT